MIIQKAGISICSTCYLLNMWHKGSGMFCSGVEGEEVMEDNASVMNHIESDYKDDIDGSWIF